MGRPPAITEPKVYISVDADFFAIKSIDYQGITDMGVTPPLETVPSYTIGTLSIDYIYPQDNATFIQCVDAVIENSANLVYHLDGDNRKAVTLSEIENDYQMGCMFQQMLAHDPVYCAVVVLRQKRRTQHFIGYKYVNRADKTKDAVGVPTEYIGASPEAILFAAEVNKSEFKAYSEFIATNPDATEAVRERYAVSIEYNGTGFTGNVSLMHEPALPVLQACVPVSIVADC